MTLLLVFISMAQELAKTHPIYFAIFLLVKLDCQPLIKKKMTICHSRYYE